MSRLPALATLALTMVWVGACAKTSKSEDHEAEVHEAHEETGGLSKFEMENGIGPLKTAITVGPIDPALAKKGQASFELKCSSCHKMAEKYVGPALGGVTVRRTPTYVMNMILDPTEMTEKHPVARDLLAQHMTQMPNLGLSQDEARSILEYLRTQAPASAGH
jgi:mono/diheme cytochrome c family protein